MLTYSFLYKLKGGIYCIFFNILGIVMLLEHQFLDNRYSAVINNIKETFPVWVLALGFIFCGWAALLYGIRLVEWNILIFLPLMVYVIATIVTYIDTKVPFIVIPFYLLTLILTLYDVLESSLSVELNNKRGKVWNK